MKTCPACNSPIFQVTLDATLRIDGDFKLRYVHAFDQSWFEDTDNPLTCANCGATTPIKNLINRGK